ncbi:MAG: acetolactate decarboxylase [Candidatus Omnitrophota bacterium]
MKKNYFLLAAVFLIITVTGCKPSENKEILFQASTIGALMEGDYEGNISFEELARRGDFGIGTFEALDGEMAAFDDVFYQAKADGSVHTVGPSEKAPFAMVTFFKPDNSFLVNKAMKKDEIEEYLDGFLPTKNIFYAVRMDGIFSYIKARSVPRQNKPYPRLAEAVKNQVVFEFNDIKGTIVGFRCPEYVKGINVPGYHLHFISEDKSSGGHLLDYSIKIANVQVSRITDFYMVLPESGKFFKSNQAGDRQKELSVIE